VVYGFFLGGGDMVDLMVLQSSRYFIHALMDDGRGSSWICTVVYMNPKD